MITIKTMNIYIQENYVILFLSEEFFLPVLFFKRVLYNDIANLGNMN